MNTDLLTGSRVAVLDLTHGGTVIARKLKMLAASVTAIDVYETASPEVLDSLEKEGIKTSRYPLRTEDFDVLIAPVHLDPDYPMLADAGIPVLSHHAAAGRILSEYDLKDKILIEITGTKAKTSTSVLLAGILSRDGSKRVLSHTSRGLEDWSTRKIIKKGLSITPASILAALDIAGEEGIKFDVFISEISLGGTGCADAGIITTIAGDYTIANNTKFASEAKQQMIINAKPESTLVLNNNTLSFSGACRRDVDIVSFSDATDTSCNVYYENINGKGIAYHLGRKHGKIAIHEAAGYDVSAYKTAFACAAAAALAMGMDDAIERSFLEFSGAEGRMKKTPLAGRTLIDNSNSGMSIGDAENALLYSKVHGRVVMLLGEEARQVCEGLEPSGVKRFIEKHLHELKALVLVGGRMLPLVDIQNNIYYADNLSKGIELAKGLTNENDIILSCVKCFR